MKRVLVTLVAAGALAGPGICKAATVTTTQQVATFGPDYTDFTNAVGYLPLFNSNLGTLEAVTLGGSYGFTSTLTITNSNPNQSSQGVTYTASALGFSSSNAAINGVISNLLDGVGSVSIGNLDMDNAAFFLQGKQAKYNLAGGGTATADSSFLDSKGHPKTLNLQPATTSDAGDLAAFEAAGGGTFDVLFNTITGTFLSNTGGNTDSTQVTKAGGSMTITYTYAPTSTPVPEPASLAILGAAILSLGTFRRLRRGRR